MDMLFEWKEALSISEKSLSIIASSIAIIAIILPIIFSLLSIFFKIQFNKEIDIFKKNTEDFINSFRNNLGLNLYNIKDIDEKVKNFADIWERKINEPLFFNFIKIKKIKKELDKEIKKFEKMNKNMIESQNNFIHNNKTGYQFLQECNLLEFFQIDEYSFDTSDNKYYDINENKITDLTFVKKYEMFFEKTIKLNIYIQNKYVGKSSIIINIFNIDILKYENAKFEIKKRLETLLKEAYDIKIMISGDLI